MKYVILVSETQTGQRVFPFIFPEYVTHKTVATCMQRGLAADRVLATPLSAGFCSISESKWRAQVGSESMDIKMDVLLNDRDAVYLNMPNALQGFLFEKG